MPPVFKTKGLVLRSIHFGETSLVVTIFTEIFGIQTYMQNGVRTSKKKSIHAAMFQPGALLDMEVYHNEQKAIQRIKDCSWAFLYQHLFSDVIKNCIALYMVELLHKTLKQPEHNPGLFYFCEDALQQLDKAAPEVAANFPLYFTIHLPHLLGLKLSDNERFLAAGTDIYLDMMEGNFTRLQPAHNYYLQTDDALITTQLLRTMHPSELSYLKLNRQKRKLLLLRLQEFYVLHIQDFGTLKTLKVLYELME